MKFEKIESAALEQALRSVTRQYLVGDLQRPQQIEFIRDQNLEIGITFYDQYTIEQPHKHTQTYEYQYVLSGYTEYMDVDSGETIGFAQGDFYLIPTDTSYAQKSALGTRILFIKVPSINDKVAVPATETVKQWYEERI